MERIMLVKIFRNIWITSGRITTFSIPASGIHLYNHFIYNQVIELTLTSSTQGLL